MVLGIDDPLVLIVFVICALFIFALYLMFRRTVLAFREGANRRDR